MNEQTSLSTKIIVIAVAIFAVIGFYRSVVWGIVTVLEWSIESASTREKVEFHDQIITAILKHATTTLEIRNGITDISLNKSIFE